MNAAAIPMPQPAPPLTLRVNFAWALVGNVAGAAAQWLLIVVLARLGNPKMVGAYALALAIAGPAFLLANLHLRTLLVTDVAGQFRLETYAGLRLIAAVLCTLALAASAGFFRAEIRGVLMAVAVWKALEAISDILHAKLQREERMDRIGKSMLARGAALVCAMLAALAAGMGVTAGAWLGAAGSAAIFLYDWAGAGRLLCFPMAVAEVGALFRTAAPLAFSLLFVSVNANIPRYFLAHYHTEREVGIFSALSYLCVAANTFILALGQTSARRLACSFISRDASSFLRHGAPMLLLAAALGMAGLMGAIAGGRPVLSFLYGREYAGESGAFIWLMAAGGAGYMGAAAGCLLSSARWIRPQVPLLGIVTSMTAASCYLLVPSRGILGAAQGQLAGCMVQILLSTVVLVFCCRRQFSRRQR